MSQGSASIPIHVSIESQVPGDLFEAMRDFIGRHPHWDQYRLMQAAVAGFLFQNGCEEPAVLRHYLDGLFSRSAATAPQTHEPV